MGLWRWKRSRRSSSSVCPLFRWGALSTQPRGTSESELKPWTQGLLAPMFGKPGESPLCLSPVSWDWNQWGRLKPSPVKLNSDVGATPPGMGQPCPAVTFSSQLWILCRCESWHYWSKLQSGEHSPFPTCGAIHFLLSIRNAWNSSDSRLPASGSRPPGPAQVDHVPLPEN